MSSGIFILEAGPGYEHACFNSLLSKGGGNSESRSKR